MHKLLTTGRFKISKQQSINMKSCLIRGRTFDFFFLRGQEDFEYEYADLVKTEPQINMVNPQKIVQHVHSPSYQMSVRPLIVTVRLFLLYKTFHISFFPHFSSDIFIFCFIGISDGN